MSAPSAISAAVGRRVRELRNASGITLEQLAKQASLRPSVLRAIEGGKVRPSVGTLGALSKPLHVTLFELVESAGSPVAPPPRVVGGLDGIARAIAELPNAVGDKLDAVGAAVVEHALMECGGNRSAAARLLGMERKALIRRWARVVRESKRPGLKSV